MEVPEEILRIEAAINRVAVNNVPVMLNYRTWDELLEFDHKWIKVKNRGEDDPIYTQSLSMGAKSTIAIYRGSIFTHFLITTSAWTDNVHLLSIYNISGSIEKYIDWAERLMYDHLIGVYKILYNKANMPSEIITYAR